MRGKALGRQLLERLTTIVTPDTILRWHRKLVAAKWTYPAKRRVGRPGLIRELRELIVRMARDNATWGSCRIQGELQKLGHRVARSTITKTLREHGVPPSPERPTPWRTFVRNHADVLATADTDDVDGFLRGTRFLILDRMILFGTTSLHRALRSYCAHDNRERPHQGVGNRVLTSTHPTTEGTRVERTERLGGLLSSYSRVA